MQMVLQVCAFVLGLLMLWWLSLRRERSSLWMTVAARADPLVGRQPAHHVAPAPRRPHRRRAGCCCFALVAWAVWKFQHRRKAGQASDLSPPPPIVPPAGSGPAAASAAALLAIPRPRRFGLLGARR